MNCCNDFGQCTQGDNCPARCTPVARIKVSRPRTCEELGICQGHDHPCASCTPIIPQPAPERRAMDDELPMGKWDQFFFWGVLAVTGSCTVLVVFGSAGWAYTRWIA